MKDLEFPVTDGSEARGRNGYFTLDRINLWPIGQTEVPPNNRIRIEFWPKRKGESPPCALELHAETRRELARLLLACDDTEETS